MLFQSAYFANHFDKLKNFKKRLQSINKKKHDIFYDLLWHSLWIQNSSLITSSSWPNRDKNRPYLTLKSGSLFGLISLFVRHLSLLNFFIAIIFQVFRYNVKFLIKIRQSYEALNNTGMKIISKTIRQIVLMISSIKQLNLKYQFSSGINLSKRRTFLFLFGYELS